jgi:putative endonuclease
MPYVVYILECSDGSYYTGSAAVLGMRLWQHEIGASSSSYTYSRRPVKLVWTSEEVKRYSDALRYERQIKGWSRALSVLRLHSANTRSAQDELTPPPVLH